MEIKKNSITVKFCLFTIVGEVYYEVKTVVHFPVERHSSQRGGIARTKTAIFQRWLITLISPFLQSMVFWPKIAALRHDIRVYLMFLMTFLPHFQWSQNTAFLHFKRLHQQWKHLSQKSTETIGISTTLQENSGLTNIMYITCSWYFG